MRTYQHLETALKDKHKAESLSLQLEPILNEKTRKYYSKNIPTELKELVHLKELFIRGIHLDEIPEWIEEFEELEELKLSVDFKTLKKLPPNLKKLSIRNKKLKEIPSIIWTRSTLTFLKFDSCTNITEIPDEIGQLTALTHLEFIYGKLTKVSSQIGKLQDLRFLRLWNNQLTEIPHTIGKLTKLIDLNLSNNQLQELPAFIGDLYELKYLEVDGNQLKELPTEIGNCSNIKWFRVGGNQLKELPAEIANCSNIEWFSVSGNQLTTFPSSFEKFTKITRFSFGYNLITEFPKFLLLQKNIEELSFVNIHLKFIPLEIINLSKLTKLKFSETHIELFPFFLLQQTSIKIIEGFSELVHAHRKSFWRAIQKLEQENQYKIYQLVNGKPFEEFEQEIHFLALTLSFNSLQQDALNYILQHKKTLLEEKPLRKGDYVTMLGKVSFNKTEMKKTLKEVGINHTAKITDKTTHVVLEKGAKNYDGFDKEGLVFMSEQTFKSTLDTFKTPYFQEKSTPEEEIKNVQQFLWTKEDDHINMGLELIKTLGVSTPLITDLFLIHKNTRIKNTLRNKAKKLLYLHASSTLKAALDTHKKVNFITSKEHDDYAVADILPQFLKDTELDAFRIVSYLCIEHKFSPYYFMIMLSNDAERLTILKKSISYKNDILISDDFFDDHYSLYSLPLEKITTLRVSHVETFPMELLQCKNLKYLDFCTHFSELPTEFTSLKKLETLYIRENNFSKFPRILESMKSLRSIVLFRNPFCEIESETPNKELYDLSSYPNYITRK